MAVRFNGDWDEAKRRLTITPKQFDAILRKAVLQEVHEIRKHIVEGIQKGAPAGKKFKPRSAFTEAVYRLTGKGGGKILIQSATLMNSVSVISVPGGAFVGVKRASGGSGRPANLASIHEFGRSFSVTVTARMRGFLAWVTKEAFGQARAPAVGTQLRITIPARPFVGPVLEKYARPDVVLKNIARRFAVLTDYQYGQP